MAIRRKRKALRGKIKLLKGRTPPTGDHAAGTWGAFTTFTGISREALRDGITDASGDGGITEANEGTLGRKFNFEPSCKTWTHGTCEAWASKWFPEPADPLTPRLVAVPIDERINSIDPLQRLAVALFMRRQEVDAASRVFDGELVCQVFTKVGVRLAVRRGLLKVSCRLDLVPPLTARLGGEDGSISFERKSNTITLTPAGQDHMHWGIEADRAPIGVVSEQLVGLFRARRLREGDEFEITFLVEDADLVADETEEIVPAAETLADSGAVDGAVVAFGTPPSASKRKLMAHIAKHSMELYGPQRPGTAVLCRYAIRIEVETQPDDREQDP
jgi:hypothetical protein